MGGIDLKTLGMYTIESVLGSKMKICAFPDRSCAHFAFGDISIEITIGLN